MKIKNIIKTLESKEEVDAVCIVGSQGRGEHKGYSDIDLFVVFKENEKKLFSFFQYIDDKPADIFFYDIATLNKLSDDPEIPANTMDAVLVNWLEDAHIEFDKSGTLTQLQKNIGQVKMKLNVPAAEMKKFESWISSAYITNKRYFDSKNSEYLELLEIKLLQDIYNLLMAYFEFRNIPWRGEKQMVRYLKENDKVFYGLYMLCIKSGSISEKFRIYSDLIKIVFGNGEYKLWDENVVSPIVKGVVNEAERNEIIKYWKGLLA